MRAGQLAGLAAVVCAGAILLLAVTGAAARTCLLPPKCTRLSVHKLAKLVHQPKMYLDHVGPLKASCTYYSAPRKVANTEPPSVPSSEIKYYASLQVSATRAPESFFGIQEKLLAKGGAIAAAPDRKLGLGRHARVYHHVITSAGLQPCQSGILYSNWTGPPDCNPQPSLEQIAVLVYRGSHTGIGTLVTVTAAAQTPPTHLTEVNVEKIAAGAFTGKLP